MSPKYKGNAGKKVGIGENKSGDTHYAQNDTELRKAEKQAYLLGNMIFRDWEDSKK